MYKEIYPEVEHGIVVRDTKSMYGYYGWPTVAKGDDGTLYAVCSGYRMAHICPFGKTVMFISRDEGKTWSSPIIINDTPLDDRDAGIVNLGGGKLLVTWFSHPAEVYLKTYKPTIKNCLTPDESLIGFAQMASYGSLSEEDARGGSFIRISRDNGLTWGKKIQIPVSAPHGPVMLSDGSLLYLGKELYSSAWENKDEKDILAAYRSTDDGESWTKLAKIEIPEGLVYDNFHEPHAIQLKSGRILGVFRAEFSSDPNAKNELLPMNFTMYSAHSDDGGRTWSPLTPMNVKGAPPHLMLHSSGALICAYGRRDEPWGERALVSHDEGETWEDYVLHDKAPGRDLGYPASVELSDGSIFTLYYQKLGGAEKCSILYTKWRLE